MSWARLPRIYQTNILISFLISNAYAILFVSGAFNPSGERTVVQAPGPVPHLVGRRRGARRLPAAARGRGNGPGGRLAGTVRAGPVRVPARGAPDPVRVRPGRRGRHHGPRPAAGHRGSHGDRPGRCRAGRMLG